MSYAPIIWKQSTIDATSYIPTSIISFVRASNGAIFAGTEPYGDVYKSIDNGLTWESTSEVSVDTTCDTVHCLTIIMDSTGDDANEVLLAGINNYVYKSANMGVSWEEMYDSTSGDVYCIIQTYDDSILIGAGNKIIKSTNYGETWEDTGFSDSYTDKINSLYQVDTNIYATTSGDRGGLFESTDGGDTWVLL